MKKMSLKRYSLSTAVALSMVGATQAWARDAELSPLSVQAAKQVFESFEIKALEDGSVAMTGFAYKECLKHFKITQTRRAKNYVFGILASTELEPCMTRQKAEHAKKTPAERSSVRQRLSALANAVIEKRDAALPVGFLNEEVDPPSFVEVLAASASRDCVDCGNTTAPGAPDVAPVAEAEELTAAMELDALEKEIAAADITNHRNLARIDRRVQDWERANQKSERTRALRLSIVTKLQQGSTFSLDAQESAVEILAGKRGLGLKPSEPSLLEAYRKLVGAGLYERVRRERNIGTDEASLRRRANDIISLDPRFEQESRLRAAISVLRSSAHVDQKGYNRTEIVDAVVAELVKSASSKSEESDSRGDRRGGALR